MDTNNKQKFNNGSKSGNNSNRGFGGFGRGRKSRTFFERPKPEFDQKIISIRRVTRVVKGGRRMTFAVSLVIGDKKGSIGIGTGKGGDTAVAINKALRDAKKSMFKIKTTKDFSIPHEISAKFGGSRIVIMPNRGKGLVAGSTARDMLILAGIKNVTAKIHSSSKNKLNNGRVTYKALKTLQAENIVAKVTNSEEKTSAEVEKKSENISK